MDVAKFFDLLLNSRLYFSNIRGMSDKFEGKLPAVELDMKRKEFEHQGMSGQELENELSIFENYYSTSMADLALANCWSLDNDESYALWKIYLGSQPYGVAVQSTIASLKNSIAKGGDSYPEDYFIGAVDYAETLPDGSNSHRLKMLTRKMPFYKYENELRLIILNYPISEGGTFPPYELKKGRTVAVDASELIHNIIVSPFAPAHFFDSIQTLVEASCPYQSYKLRKSRILDR